MPQFRFTQLALACLIFLLLSQSLFAQATSALNPRDDKYRLLGLKRAKEAYETSRKEYERQSELHKRDLITEVELEQARNRFADAEVNYQQSLLTVLFEGQFITVKSAVKYYADDGSKHVRLSLANTSGGGAEFQKLVNIDDELFRSLQPDVINNIYVSILNEDNAIISQPYETKISQLRYGKPVTIDFTLLQDLDAVTVYMIYANGSERRMRIILQKDQSVDRVAVQSERFSQEVDLGKSASFDLTLELFSGTTNTFALRAVNLPREISRSFFDASGRVRLSQVKFTETTDSKRASLKVSLPDRPSEAVVIDQPIQFYVLVLPREQLASMPDFETTRWTEAELEQLDVGFVRLELLPRGKGELLVRAAQLYHAVDVDEAVTMSIEVVNEGSHRLDNIEVELDLPLNWSKEIEPALVSSLEISKDRQISLTFIPPVGVSPGKYDIRIRTTAMSGSEPVIGDDKTVTVEIKASANLLGTLLIVILILALVGGIVVFGVRLSRR